MESVACDFCGSKRNEVIFIATRKHWSSTIVKCKKCNLVFTNPRLSPDELKQFYNEQSYFEHKNINNEVGHNYIDIDSNMEMAEQRISWLNHFKSPPGEFLEIGCATGANLLAAKNAGWNATGVEISEFASSFARQTLGLNVITGTLEDVSFKDESFDAIGLYQVLEHVPSPTGILLEVKRILKKGGILALDVPDFGSRISKMLGAEFQHLKPPEHIYHFTNETLAAIIQKNSFKVLKLRRFGGGGTIFFNVETGKQSNNILYTLFNMRKIIYKSKYAKRFVRYFYWHMLRNNDYIHLIAKKQ